MKIKKVLASVAALSVLMFSTLTVCAAPSSTVTTAADVTKVIAAEGGIEVKAVDNATVQSAAAAVKEVLATNTSGEIASVVDLSAGSATKLADGNYEVTVSIPAIAANETVIVLHFTNGKWEQINPTSVVNGKVTFKTASFSPFAFIKVSAKTSPKTGETIPYAAVVLVIGTIAAVACGKKFFA